MTEPIPEDEIPAFRQKTVNRYSDQAQTLADPCSLAQFILDQRNELIEQIRTGGSTPSGGNAGGLSLSLEFSNLIDASLVQMVSLACETVQVDPQSLKMAIVATGGYGRRELAPFSDIDITFIPQRDGDARTDRVVRELFRLVMDVFIARCGLDVGYAYRLMSDCNSLDHQTACGLLDARQVAGNERLFIQFEDAFWSGFNAADFIFTKVAEREGHLRKWGILPRTVEPQIKEGPGGLRDLQTAIWVIQAHNHVASAGVRGTRGLNAIASELGLTDSEHNSLIEGKDYIFRLRAAMHVASGSERDQLVVTRQEQIAQMLGYVDDLPYGRPAVEKFMADLYPVLALNRRLADRAIRHVLGGSLMLGIGLDAVNKEIVPANRSIQTDDPSWMVWACELAQRYDLDLSDKFQSAALHTIASGALLRDSRQAAESFTAILSRIGRVYRVLQLMADLKILDWLLPEFAGVMDLIPYDASHDYTVGQHTLLVIKHLEGLLDPNLTEDLAEMRHTLQELAHPEYLILAALLHDTGKAVPGRPHAEVSAQLVDAVCQRLGWSEEAASQVRFLVSEHLLMGETARLRDLNIEKSIRDFVRIVDDPERLNMLYLLTYADMRAVGEGIWTPVKGRFLRDLWQKSSTSLFDSDSKLNPNEFVKGARKHLKRELTLEKFDIAEVEEHIEAMPPYYLLNTSLHDIAMHLGFLRRVQAGEIVIDCHDERSAQFTELTICKVDDPEPGLLAKIGAVLVASSLNVHSVSVVTRSTAREKIAIDTLLVDFKGRQLTPGKKQEICSNLGRVLSGAANAADLLGSKLPVMSSSGRSRNRNRSVGKVEVLTISSVSNDFDDGVSMIEAAGPLTLDLFYKVCTAAATLRLNIVSAKVSTTRELANVSLYVTGARHMTESDLKRRFLGVLSSLPDQATTRAS